MCRGPFHAPCRGLKRAAIMAIGCIKVGIMHAGVGSARGMSAYITREKAMDQITGADFDFRHRADELIEHGILVPDDAPDWARDADELWKRATEKQMTVDRKTGEQRFKNNAQIAKTFVFALPRELSDDECRALAKDALTEWFGGKRVAVQWAIHRDETGPHMHVMQTTNSIDNNGFGNKATWMNPNFGFKNGKSYVSEEDHQNDRWTSFQESWFADHGICDERGAVLRCDAVKIALERTRGQSATQIAERTGSSELSEQNADQLAEMQAVLRKSPATLLFHATKMESTFTARDLERILAAHEIRGVEAASLIEIALSDRSILQARDAASEIKVPRYTTLDVVAQERLALDDVQTIMSGPLSEYDSLLAMFVADKLTLREDQKDAFLNQIYNRFSLTIGDPGTGKSHELRALREYKEAQGKHCIAVGPTNNVKSDMKKEGFDDAFTLTKTLILLDKGKIILDRNTVIICDEGAMIDTAQMSRLIRAIARSGAELHIVGDNKQLSSVPRGGLFTEIEKKFGAVRLTYITRQTGWQQQASTDLSNGNVASAISAYENHGCIKHNATLEESKKQLVAEWNGKDFIFAGLRKSVADLNEQLRVKAISLKLVESDGIEWPTDTGNIIVARGDRLQMSANLNQFNIANGTVCTVKEIKEHGLLVRFDGDKHDQFLPSGFKGVAHGYAGTVYRGQGKSIPGVGALHDSAFMWGAETGLVGLTRHKQTVKLYTSADIAANNVELIKQLAVSRAKRAAISYQLGPTDRQLDHQVRVAEAAAQAQAAKEAAAAMAAEERRAASAFAARTKELIEMLRDGRRIEIADGRFTAAGMNDVPEILAELHQRPEIGHVVLDALAAQTAREETARTAAADAARIAAEKAALDATVRCGVENFRQQFEQEKAGRAAAAAERQRIAETERQRVAEAEQQRQRAAEAARPRSRSQGWSM